MIFISSLLVNVVFPHQCKDLFPRWNTCSAGKRGNLHVFDYFRSENSWWSPTCIDQREHGCAKRAIYIALLTSATISPQWQTAALQQKIPWDLQSIFPLDQSYKRYVSKTVDREPVTANSFIYYSVMTFLNLQRFCVCKTFPESRKAIFMFMASWFA